MNIMKSKILLADDVEELAEAVGAVLEFNNYEVDIVNNGKEAFEKAKNNLVELFINNEYKGVYSVGYVEAPKQ